MRSPQLETENLPSTSSRDSTDEGAAGQADWLVGGGEMAKFIKTKDWSETALGPIESWPQSLRTVVSLMQASNSPISLSWGSGHVQIYNDGYWPICGDKHPTSMGQDFRECWAAPWPVIREAYETALAGKTSYLKNVRMYLERYGFFEETWFTFSFSPITDESGKVGGLFHPVTEVTSQMLAERRARTLRDLAGCATKATTTPDAFALAAQVLSESELDLPFFLLYLVEADGRSVKLVAQSGLDADTPVSPRNIDIMGVATAPWLIAEVVATGRTQMVEDAAERLAGMSVGPYPELPKVAFAMPIMEPGHLRPAAVMVIGTSARLPMNDSYRVFCDLIAAGVSTALANARAHEEERRKAQELVELDRAKTDFFSNVSHEFRTPLTLMLGPLEDELHEQGSALSGARRERVTIAHRSCLRLLKLVNTLLDFSRIQASRMEAHYQPTDLAAVTIDVASNFRSAIEQGGLTLTVDCPPLPQLVYVDRDMWEKIVLNLLSNAFKHTFKGGIHVNLSWCNDCVELSVHDTGVGIHKDNLSKLFQRFHRVIGAASRTHEGTGIGLSLVQELVNLHKGTIRVESEEGKGSCFILRIPVGNAHLPADKVGNDEPQTAIRRSAAAYVAEAMGWLPDALPIEAENGGDHAKMDEPAEFEDRPRVLWADDNADMRRYVAHLLGQSYDVTSVSDGEEALHAAVSAPYDLVVSDVMMPNLDGFGLIKALRANERTRELPVILLSARTGQEAALGGLDAGADDYLVKPFSAKELLARVAGLIARQRASEKVRSLSRQFEALAAASLSISKSVAGLAEGSIDTVLRTIAVSAQELTGAKYAAIGTDSDPSVPFAPWIYVGLSEEEAALIERFPRPLGALGALAGRNELLPPGDLREQQSIVEFPPNHPLMKSFLGVPICFGDRTLGNLFLSEKPDGRAFTPQDQRIVDMLAQRAGVAIETARLYQQEALERAWLESVLEQMPEAVILQDPEGKVVLQSRRFLSLSHVAGDKVPSSSPERRWPDLRRASGEALLPDESPIKRAMQQAEPVTGLELRVDCADGTKLPVIASAASVRRRDGKIAGATMILQDISAIKELERMREEWSAMVAHDLQQPVSAIMLWAQVLLRGDLGESERDDVQHIQEATAHMSRMIKDLFDASKVEARRLQLNRRPLALGAVAKLIAERDPNIAPRIRFHQAVDKEVLVLADRGRIEQVLTNLLSNSVKYGASDTPIEVRVTLSGENVAIEVKNRGPGISAAELPHLFERFWRAEGAKKSAVSGTGLGLYIAKGLIEAHGGRMWAESIPGETTSFHLSLPIFTPAETSN